MNSFKPNASEVGQRLDAVLAVRFNDRSRSYWTKAISKQHITVDGQKVKSGYKLSKDDKVVISLSENTHVQPTIPVIYEDEQVIVIDKPYGILVHENSNFTDEYTLVEFMEKLFSGKDERRGIAHRLDRTTSGVMIIAKNDRSLVFLKKQFAERTLNKKYLAICSGVASKDKAIIKLPIERNPKQPNTFRVGVNGKDATTIYKVLEHKADLSKVELIPKTGRTHQLRVHLSYIGMPILGDETYGGRPAPRIMLHATELSLELPSGEQKTFKSDPPKEFGYE